MKPEASRSHRIYRALLRLFPFDFQREYGGEMEAVFAEEGCAGKNGGRTRLWRRTLAGVLQTAPAEHLDVLGRDLRYAVRSFRRKPGFVIVAVTALAVGIGANLTIFGFANAFLLDGLPVSEPHQLVRAYGGRGGRANVPFDQYLAYRDQNRTLASLAAFGGVSLSLRTDGSPEQVQGLAVTGNYFETLGVAAALGRRIGEEDDMDGASGALLLDDAFWRSRFGGETGIVGRTVTMDGAPFTIIGVASPSFTGTMAPLRPDVYVAWNGPHNGSSTAQLIGRLRPDASIEGAQAEVSGIATGLSDALGNDVFLTLYSAKALNPEIALIAAGFVGILLALSILVLLVACLNVAGLMLVRATERQKEIGVRIALGAGRGQLVRQFMTESLLLSIAGGLAAVALAIALARIIVATLPAAVPMPVVMDFGLDWRFGVFAVALGLLTTCIVGLAPALHSTRSDVAAGIKDGSVVAGVRRSRLRAVFVLAQVGLSTLLLVSAGLLIRSLSSPQAADRGFVAEGVLAASFNLESGGYTPERAAVFVDSLLARLEASPQVLSASMVEIVPLTMWNREQAFLPEGMETAPESGRLPLARINSVSGGHFETLGIPLLAGRDFAPGDRQDSPAVAIVNEIFAERFWPGESPLGRRLRSSRFDPVQSRIVQDGPSIEVIGLARNSKYAWMGESPTPFIYLPATQAQSLAGTLLLKASGDPLSALPLVRNIFQELDPDVPVFSAGALADATAITLLPARVAAAVAGVLGGLALALGAIGSPGSWRFLCGCGRAKSASASRSAPSHPGWCA